MGFTSGWNAVAARRIAELEGLVREQEAVIARQQDAITGQQAWIKERMGSGEDCAACACTACAGLEARAQDLQRAVRDARDVAAGLSEIVHARVPPEERTMGNVQFLTAELSNQFFRQRQNAAHYEEQVAQLRGENEILQRVCDCAPELFAAAQELHAVLLDLGAELGSDPLLSAALLSAASRLKVAFAKCDLFSEFMVAREQPTAQLGSTLAAKLLEDTGVVMPELVRWAESFFPAPPVDRQETLPYVTHVKELETQLVALLKDYSRQATATACFRTLAQEFTMISHKAQNARARELLAGNPELLDRVFAARPLSDELPDLKYPVVYGAPRRVIRQALLHVVAEHQLDLDPKLLDPDLWASLDPLFPLSHFIADLDVQKPALFVLDKRVAQEVSRFGRADACEDGSYRYSLASCYLARAVCMLSK
jgi:hypothetical protein